jgi:hypothetical protein
MTIANPIVAGPLRNTPLPLSGCPAGFFVLALFGGSVPARVAILGA